MRIPCSVAIALLAAGLHAEPNVRIVGSSTVRNVLETVHEDLAAAGHCHIEFSSTGSLPGLLALTGDTADIAMLSMPLEDAANAINRKTPGRIDPRALRSVQVGEMRTVFIVNPRNPVRLLNSEQLTAILAGTVSDWKDVGGNAAPITVVSLGGGGTFLDKLLNGRAITASARVVSRASQIAAIVAAEANAIGIVSAAHPRGQTTVVQTDVSIAAPLLLVTRGEPTPEIAAIETAAVAALKTR